ncbi:MAG TPA: choice-of-anchor tandem repeat GloVer-containing protein, partial [Pirellulales bacterium]
DPNSLTVSGTTLFGTAGSGGTSAGGTIYSINSSGAGYTQYQNFGSATGDGLFPNAGLTQLGSKFYGTTAQGGGSGSIGTIFSVNTDGSGLTFLRKFLGGANDGSFAFSDLIAVGAKLYGTANQGGASNKGIVFSYDTASSQFATLHSFGSIANDGSQPVGGVTLVGSTLYGTTQVGGASPTSGIIYSLNTDGTGYQVVQNFLGGFIDGAQPRADLTLVNNTLFGTTVAGGSSGGGTVFALAVPEPAAWIPAALAAFALVGMACGRSSPELTRHSRTGNG